MMKTLVCLGCVFAVAATNPCTAFGQLTAANERDVRITGDLDDLATGGGNAGDENGGNTALVVGLNTGNVQNWALFGFDSFGGMGGETASGATLRLDTNSLTNANHGDVDNTFSIHQLHPGNLGWVQGGGTIANNVANVAGPGVVTFRQLAAGDPADLATTPGSSWVDASGAAVPNFIDAFDATAINTNVVIGFPNSTQPVGEELVFEFDAATAQAWLDADRADFVLQVNGPDNTSRFVIQNGGTNTLTILTAVPEPSSALVLLGGLAGVVLRRRR